MRLIEDVQPRPLKTAPAKSRRSCYGIRAHAANGYPAQLKEKVWNLIRKR